MVIILFKLLVYFLQTKNYIMVLNIDEPDFGLKQEEEMASYIKKKASQVKNLHIIYFTEADLSE